ncbi:MAG TPA: hypothetical protein VLC09_07910 [Polyangiaceae bacterium]|nr:hypothetical protein [Polyangiaceae bacterium]
MTDEEIRHAVEHELARIESEAATRVRASGWLVVGARALKQLSPFKRARSWEPIRSLNPTFAVGRGQRDAFFEAVRALRAFRTAYRDALDAWRQGMRSVPFPRATWLMRVVHGVELLSA